MVNQLNEILEAKLYDDFFNELPKIVLELTEEERKTLLVDIIDYHYTYKYHKEFVDSFDLLIDTNTKLNLNFNIDHWAPTFLCLVILRAPFVDLFDYFIKKGADINFVGDVLAFENEVNYEFEKKFLLFGQFQTCLDFIDNILGDLFMVDYFHEVPGKRIEEDWREVTEDEGDITIPKKEYLNLYEQAEYLYALISTEKLKRHIIFSGGKIFDEISGKTISNEANLN